MAETLLGHQAAPRRQPAHGFADRAAAREAAPARGRGAGPRRGARHLLRRRRRSGQPDRGHHRRRRAAVPLPGPVPRAQAAGPEGHPALRASRLRQDPHRQGGGQLPGQEGLRGHRRHGLPVLLPQHQGPRAAQQVRGRDRAPDPPGLPAGPGKEPRRASPSSSSSTRWTPSSGPVARASRRTWSRRSCPSCWPRSTGSRP